MTNESSTAPRAPADWTVAGVQTATGVEGRARVEVLVRGKYTGSVDRGSGVDQLRVAVWDDGQEKDFKVVDIPLGTTAALSVRLGFDGLYAVVADGIGVTVSVGSDAGGEHVFHLDPFVPAKG